MEYHGEGRKGNLAGRKIEICEHVLKCQFRFGLGMQLEVDEINSFFPYRRTESGLDEKRDLRDQLNAKVRAYLDNQNEVNRQVKELISESDLRKIFEMLQIRSQRTQT